ncbi:MAG: folate family ECF transporter S component [Clostridia bacterium]|nr:folate family ECF transporter S component [Clostridia bacterium]
MKNTNSTSKNYALPISDSYWKSALAEMKNVRALIMCALLCAVSIILEKFQIPIIPGVLEVSFSFISISLCSFLTGPVIAIPCGIIVDIVGALINGYSFFFGYTLSAVLGAFIYALFLYRTRLSFERIAAARFTINLFVNVLLGSVWRVAMSGGPYGYYVAISGIKNLLLLPLEVFIMTFFLGALLPSLKKLKLCDPTLELKVSSKKMIIFTIVLIAGTALLILYSLNKSEINSAIKSVFG